MKIVVIGGSGLIGTKVVESSAGTATRWWRRRPNPGVNAVTGEGLAEALSGAQVVVDVANSPSFEDKRRAGVLRDLGPQPAGRGSRRRRRAPRRVVGRRHRAPPRRAAISAPRWRRKT